MSIRWKLILGALSFLLLFIAVFVATSVVTSGQKTDGLLINLAGRQRMLAEKMTKELLAYAEAPSEETWNALLNTKTIFGLTHQALSAGGPAPSTLDPKGDTADLPTPTDDIVKNELAEVDREFQALSAASDRLEAEARSAKDEGDMVVAQVPEVLSTLEDVLRRSQKVASNEMLDTETRAEWTQIIKLVSRQSLLAQRLGTMALGYLRSPSEEAKQELEAVLEIFDSTHAGLTESGTVILDLDEPDTSGVMIAAAPNPRVQQSLAETGDEWSVFRRALRGVQTAAVARASALQGALDHSPKIVAGMNRVVARAQVLSEAKVATVQTVQIIALVLGILFVVVAALIGNGIGTGVVAAVDAAETIADGDLTHRSDARARDETGRLLASLNDMTSQLSDLVRQVQVSGLSVSTSSTQIAGNAQRQESAVSDLSSTATEMAATSTEIAATADQLLETMNAVGEVSENTSRSAANSKRGLEDMERTMAQMVESTEAVQERLAAINEKTAKISTVVTTIMKIAQQTNLISLNAAIEAENAGELGLGFAVVAKEVRRLADQTSKASKGIEKMVQEMQSAVSTAVMGMDGFSDDIRTGSDSVQQVATRLGRIIEQVEELVPQFESVREGMSAQAEGAGQIAVGVRRIVDSSEETAESVRQTNAAITQLTRAAEELQDGVSRFRVG
ncbi:MAG: methyl-accepting chemotaxis protein, partial [Planctomycetota bacterium]|nr:methyl-accepting chemotaxis protein [Planctomycetota bacterium]